MEARKPGHQEAPWPGKSPEHQEACLFLTDGKTKSEKARGHHTVGEIVVLLNPARAEQQFWEQTQETGIASPGRHQHTFPVWNRTAELGFPWLWGDPETPSHP